VALTQTRTVAIATMAALVLASGGVAPAAFAQNAGRNDMVTLDFCNRTSGKVFLALMYRERPGSSNWIVEGWKVIQGGSCFNITVPNDGSVYDYAEDESDGTWGGSFKLCVEHPGPFRRVNSADFTCSINYDRLSRKLLRLYHFPLLLFLLMLKLCVVLKFS